MRSPKVSKQVLALIKKKQKTAIGFCLDVGCGGHKQEGFLGMDMRKTPCVDIVHDIQQFPWPIPDDSCSRILCSHILEHIDPSNTLNVLNEMWRVMKVGGQLMISVPYGLSYGFIQDPTHKNPWNEATLTYFDPDYPLFDVYCHTTKPWRIERSSWYATGNLEAILEKRPITYRGQFSPKGGSK